MTPGELYVATSVLSAKDAVELIEHTKEEWDRDLKLKIKKEFRDYLKMHPISSTRATEIEMIILYTDIEK